MVVGLVVGKVLVVQEIVVGLDVVGKLVGWNGGRVDVVGDWVVVDGSGVTT